MNAQLELLLEDKPGMLLQSLTPIAKAGGNILSVVHDRSKMRGGFVPTTIFCTVSSRDVLKHLIDLLYAENIRIVRVISEGETLHENLSFSVILVGHVMETDPRDTLDRLMAKGARVSKFSVSITEKSQPSSVLLMFECDKKNVESIFRELSLIAQEKSLLVIPE